MWPEIDASGGPNSRQPDGARWDDGYRWAQIFIIAVPSYVSNSTKVSLQGVRSHRRNKLKGQRSQEKRYWALWPSQRASRNSRCQVTGPILWRRKRFQCQSLCINGYGHYLYTLLNVVYCATLSKIKKNRTPHSSLVDVAYASVCCVLKPVSCG